MANSWKVLIAIWLLLAMTVVVRGDDGLDLPVAPGTEPAPPVDEPLADDPVDEPPPVFYGEEIETPSDSLIYVIDVSGSMMVDWLSRTGEGNRLDRAKLQLLRSIDSLSPNIRFNIVAYSCEVRPWRPVTILATPENKAEASWWVTGLRPGGATGTAVAVIWALSDRENLTVVLLTDGAPGGCGAAYGNPDEQRNMIRVANSQGAKIKVFGIQAFGWTRAFCMGVAADSGGSYTDVN